MIDSNEKSSLGISKGIESRNFFDFDDEEHYEDHTNEFSAMLNECLFPDSISQSNEQKKEQTNTENINRSVFDKNSCTRSADLIFSTKESNNYNLYYYNSDWQKGFK